MTADVLRMPYAVSAPSRVAGPETVPADASFIAPRQPAAESLASHESEPIVRTARLEDLDALVAIELNAYADVYGTEPSDETIAGIRTKYENRLNLLGDWVRVLENPTGVYGVLVCCRTNKSREDFLSADDRDMTSNEGIRDIYDPEGKNVYVVNLAVLPSRQGKRDYLALLESGVQKSVESGVEHAYFASRMPGFGRWAEKQKAVAERLGVELPHMADLAEEYRGLTRIRRGKEESIDPLLRMYEDFGCNPLRLIENAWKPDKSSEGFGVLFEYDVPAGERLGFMRRSLEWAKRHKKGLALGSLIAASATYTTTHGGLGQVVEQAQESMWATTVYPASLAVFAGGAAIMLAGAGRKITWKNLFAQPREEMRAVAAKLPESKLVETGFWVNAAGAVAAASAAIVAVTETLPPAAAIPAMVIPAADLVQTLALRYWAIDLASRAKPEGDTPTE